MIRAGGGGGVLGQVLERLASLLERDRAIRKRLSAALAIGGVSFGGALVLSHRDIVPAFAGLFEQMHVHCRFQRVLIVLGRMLSGQKSPSHVAGAMMALLEYSWPGVSALARI